MARNIEIKASIDSVDALLPKVAAIATEGPSEIAQDDTFFKCDSGRLKLRCFSATAGELIFYQRADQSGPKTSFYELAPTATPDALRQCLSLAYGQVGRVRKQRTLFLLGRTRIHLDRVEGLGHFIELEAVLADDESIESGLRDVDQLMLLLGIEPARCIADAYVDLLARSGPPQQAD